MKNKLYFIIILLCSPLLTCVSLNDSVHAASKKTKERLAVLDLDATHGIEQSLAEALSEIVRDKIHGYGEYQVMSKSDLQALASREQLRQAVGCDDGSGACLVDFGRAIGTRFMVAGTISKIGTTYTISLRMLDTRGEDAGVINRVSKDCKCDEDGLIDTTRDVAAILIGKPPKSLASNANEKQQQEALRLAEQKRIEDEKAAIAKKEEEKKQRKITEEKQRQEALRLAEQKRIEDEKAAITKKEEEEKQRKIAEEKQRKEALRLAEQKRIEDEKAAIAKMEEVKMSEKSKRDEEAREKQPKKPFVTLPSF